MAPAALGLAVSVIEPLLPVVARLDVRLMLPAVESREMLGAEILPRPVLEMEAAD